MFTMFKQLLLFLWPQLLAIFKEQLTWRIRNIHLKLKWKWSLTATLDNIDIDLPCLGCSQVNQVELKSFRFTSTLLHINLI